MSGSSSVAAMKKVVQQLRLEAGLNRVKVSGRGRAVGPGGSASPAGLWAVGRGRGAGPPFRRPWTLPGLSAPDAESRHRLPSPASHLGLNSQVSSVL